MIEPSWNYMPCRLPRRNCPVLVVKGDEKKTFVREAVYAGKGYWSGFGNAPVLAWRPLPHTPITLALKTVLDERDTILDTLDRKRTAQQNKRLVEIDREIEMAQQARESRHERFVRECFEALSAPAQEIEQALSAVISIAQQDMKMIALEAGSTPPGIQYPRERYTVIVRRTKRRRKSATNFEAVA